MGKWLARRTLEVVGIALLLLALLFSTWFVMSKINVKKYTDFSSMPTQNALVIHNSSDAKAEPTYRQIKTAMDFSKIAYREMDIIKDNTLPDLGSYTSLVMVVSDIGALSDSSIEKINTFVGEGGGLLVAYPVWHSSFEETFGLQTGGTPAAQQMNEGINFTGDLLPGIEGLVVEADDVSPYTTLGLSVDPEAVYLIASSESSGHPLVWSRRYKNGYVVYWNNNLLARKEFRGLFVQSFLAGQPAAAVALVNFATVDVRNFPAPITSERVNFYDSAWMPDMLFLGQRYLRTGHYAFGVVFSDSDDAGGGEYDFSGWEAASIETNRQQVPFLPYAAEQLAQKHELALGGYNSALLASDTGALEAVRERWEADNLGDTPHTYMPPIYAYSKEGLDAVRQVYPDMVAVKGYAFGEYESGGMREFGPEPWNGGLYAIPCWSEGYSLDGMEKLKALSELWSAGAWTHCIDAGVTPGDWKSNGSSHDGLYYDLEAAFSFMEDNYPWLRFTGSEEARKSLELYDLTRATFTFDRPYQFKAEFKGGPAYIAIRINDGRKVALTTFNNFQVIHFYEGHNYNLYILRATGEESTVGLVMPSWE